MDPHAHCLLIKKNVCMLASSKFTFIQLIDQIKKYFFFNFLSSHFDLRNFSKVNDLSKIKRDFCFIILLFDLGFFFLRKDF